MAESQKDVKVERGARLKVFYKAVGLTQTKLAQLVGADQTAISMAVDGKRNVQRVWLYRLKEKYNSFNDEWLWTGEGEMFTGETSEKNVEEGIMVEESSRLSNGRPLKKEELEKMLLRLTYRMDEMEEWKRQADAYIARMEREIQELEQWKNKATVALIEGRKRKDGIGEGE